MSRLPSTSRPIPLLPDPGTDTAQKYPLTPEAEAKEVLLLERIGGLGSAIVAYSGGIDSTYLLWATRQALKERVLAVIGRSDSYARSEMEGALVEAGRQGAAVKIIRTAELQDPRFRNNPTNRCYHCKSELYSKLAPIALQEGYACVLDGTNRDDLGDYRPGRRAAEEKDVLSPLAEVGLTKAEIRALARRAGIPLWEKPAMPCLSSRFPYGTDITSEKLRQVEEAEAWLRGRGFLECRVRHHGELARVEVAKEEVARITVEPLRSEVTRALTALGFQIVTVDPEGFRSGKLNRDLPADILEQEKMQ